MPVSAVILKITAYENIHTKYSTWLKYLRLNKVSLMMAIKYLLPNPICRRVNSPMSYRDHIERI